MLNNFHVDYLEIIYSDKDIIVLNKPPGISVHGGSSVTAKTMVDFLLRRFPEIQNIGDDPAVRPGIVHRLDKDTSGIMVVARTQESFSKLKELFTKRLVEKTYRAIVCGEMKEKIGRISFPLGRIKKNPMKRGIPRGKGINISGAREAVTEYKVLKQGKKLAYVELRPQTGRMHQLRVHMASIGHPIACDKLYGGKNVCCPEGASRQLLHASSISFTLDSGKRVFFEADLPEDFLHVLEKVK